MAKATLLTRLLDRGDIISVTDGRWEIAPLSGKAAPSLWLKENRETLNDELASLISTPILSYDSYSTGRYGKSKNYPGVTLTFFSHNEGLAKYVIFNVELSRPIQSH
jgi:hypothetical protein